MKRIKTGIKGLDGLIKGGFPEKSNILVCGSPGTGKTIFGLEFIYNGVTKYNENGIIVTFDEEKQDLIEQATELGWDLGKLEQQNKLRILYFDVLKIDAALFEIIIKAIKEINAKRLVFDSISDISLNIGKDITISGTGLTKEYTTQQFVYYTIHNFKSLGTTNLFISDASEKGEFITRDTVSEFICDNVIIINLEAMGGEFSRTLLIRKMRKTAHDEDWHPLEISKKGMIVHKLKTK